MEQHNDSICFILLVQYMYKHHSIELWLASNPIYVNLEKFISNLWIWFRSFHRAYNEKWHPGCRFTRYHKCWLSNENYLVTLFGMLMSTKFCHQSLNLYRQPLFFSIEVGTRVVGMSSCKFLRYQFLSKFLILHGRVFQPQDLFNYM